MIVGMMQPYFMPYIGYFQLIKAVDTFVVLDDVNYINGGWINRNNILVNGAKYLFTIKLKGASQNKLINEIEIGDDFQKLKKTIRINYGKAPFYKDVILLVDRILSYDNKILSEFIINSLKEISNYLNIDSQIVISSKLNNNYLLKGKDIILNECSDLGADVYINAIGGQKLYDKAEFASHNVDLKFIQTVLVPYKQFKNEFIPFLSILDVMMFNSVEEVNVMLNKYDLI